MPEDKKEADDMTAALSKSLDTEFGARTHEGLASLRAAGASRVGSGDYAHLDRILNLAQQQASTGKGAERHATSFIGRLTWDQQPILANARQVGPGGPAMQVQKKSSESVMMSVNGNFEGAKAEALGCIVYAAALYKLYEEMEAAAKINRR